MADTGLSFEDLIYGGSGGVGGGGGGGGRIESNPFSGFAPSPVREAVPAAKPESVDKQPVRAELVKELQHGVSRIRVIKAVREATGFGLKESKEAVDATFESIKEQLSPDAVGTLRHDTYGTGNYAFAIKPGEYLLIDPSRPAYKAATGAESAAAKGWQLLVKGSG